MAKNNCTNKVRVEMTRESDGTYSVSVEDLSAKKTDHARYVDGLSEGFETDPTVAAEIAGRIVRDWLAGNVDKIA